MGLFSKKQGGTFFGNLIASVANKYTGGVLGAKRVAQLTSGDLTSINAGAKQKSKVLQGLTFAGEGATKEADGTIVMDKQLDDVSVSAKRTVSGTSNPNPYDADSLWEKLKGKVSELGAAASKDTKFGVDNSTKFLIGGGFLIFALVLIVNSSSKH